MKIYEYQTSLHDVILNKHVYSRDIDRLTIDIDRIWKSWKDRHNIIRSTDITNSPLKIYHLLEFPLDLDHSLSKILHEHVGNLIIWFHYDPSEEEIKILESRYKILFYLFDQLKNTENLRYIQADNNDWSILKEIQFSSQENISDYIFLPLINPITRNQSDHTPNGYLIKYHNTEEETREDLYFNSDSYYIAFSNPQHGSLVLKKDCSELLDSRIDSIWCDKDSNFTWLEFPGCYLSESTDDSKSQKINTTLLSYNKKSIQGIPPFHTWSASKENIIYIQTPIEEKLIPYAWTTFISSKSELDQVLSTKTKLDLSDESMLYIYYFKSIFDVKVYLDDLDDHIVLIELDNHIEYDTNETEITLFILYWTPAKIIVWFHSNYSPTQNIKYRSNHQDTIFYTRTQYFEESYLKEVWLSDYVTYRNQTNLKDVDQNLFRFAKKKDWFALLVALWIVKHIHHKEENTASQVLLIAMESIKLSYHINSMTDLVGIIQDKLFFGYPEHTLDNYKWSYCLSGTHRISSIVKNQVPIEWKSSLGCCISLANNAKPIST